MVFAARHRTYRRTFQDVRLRWSVPGLDVRSPLCVVYLAQSILRANIPHEVRNAGKTWHDRASADRGDPQEPGVSILATISRCSPAAAIDSSSYTMRCTSRNQTARAESTVEGFGWVMRSWISPTVSPVEPGEW